MASFNFKYKVETKHFDHDQDETKYLQKMSDEDWTLQHVIHKGNTYIGSDTNTYYFCKLRHT